MQPSILLASDSPRRGELLTSVGIPFMRLAPEVDESRRDYLAPALRVVALAEDKARVAGALAQAEDPLLVLAADTLVCLPGEGPDGEDLALGKPRDVGEARAMILSLSAKAHVVRTGLALLDRVSGTLLTSRSDTTVSFAYLSEGDVEAYLDTAEWVGVAGAYRIQGLASLFIERLEGSWTGVVGLPLRELYVILAQAGYRLPSMAPKGSPDGKGFPTVE
jgi:septum formation protein